MTHWASGVGATIQGVEGGGLGEADWITVPACADPGQRPKNGREPGVPADERQAQGLKPLVIPRGLRVPEGPLFHGDARLWIFRW